ncbi:DUF6941 family protein [Conexibacter woesei]|uniref:ApaG domain protein n=1 Tax=Conexibacter woesei (strain DSM 14684 / CCUG 47730 / CIP 108061 / JCM 11494 / NBRC 100937 / ID131577) TaxID=469383 RepID=D3FD19_CONWI|nr:hypothetical protein [Conexibacter woesei]ADB51531.1 hypothetical protein Cwoe_3112 [Conexibacter woesei DSM 14684]
MEADLLLCDHAEAINGKLYIMGAAWNLLQAPEQAITIALAIVVKVAWDEADTSHELIAELLDADGERIVMNGEPVAPSGRFELGRPTGVKPGSTLNMPLAFNLSGLVLGVGQYEWRLTIDGDPVARAPFAVVDPVAAV